MLDSTLSRRSPGIIAGSFHSSVTSIAAASASRVLTADSVGSVLTWSSISRRRAPAVSRRPLPDDARGELIHEEGTVAGGVPEHPRGNGCDHEERPGDIGVPQADDAPCDEIRAGEQHRGEGDEQEGARVRREPPAEQSLHRLRVDDTSRESPPEVKRRRRKDECGGGSAEEFGRPAIHTGSRGVSAKVPV